MPVPAAITDLSTTAGSNSPSGGESPGDGDNYIRQYGAFIAALRDMLNGTTTSTLNAPTVLGQAKFADGSAAAPSITFTADTDNGLYRTGANSWGLSAAGALKLQISSSELTTYADVVPTSDAAYSLGLAAKRYSVAYAGSMSDGAAATAQLVGSTGTTVNFANGSDWTAVVIKTAGVARLTLSSAGAVGTVTSATGGASTFGYRGMPASSQTSGALTAECNGKKVQATGGCTINNGVFADGDTFVIRNTTAGNITITQGGGTTLELAGTATTGSRTLAQKGVMTVTCNGGDNFTCTGAGVT